MELLGTVAHSRCTVVRLSCRMVPKPQFQTQRISVKLLPWLKGPWLSPAHTDLLCGTRRNYLTTPHCCCFCKMLLALGPKHCLVFARTQSCEREEGAQQGREGTGLSMLWAAQQLPQLKHSGFCVALRGWHGLCVSTLGCDLWRLKSAKDIEFNS